MKDKIIEALNLDYNNRGETLISDMEYDQLVDHNKYLDRKKYVVKNNRFTRKHKTQIKGLLRVHADLSKEKVITEEECKSNSVISSILDRPYIVTLKLDGVFGSAYYNAAGDLEYCLTRNDTINGISIEEKMLLLGLPKKISYDDIQDIGINRSKGAIVNFEVCLSVKNFELLGEGASHLSVITGFINCKKPLDYIKTKYGKLIELAEIIVHDVKFDVYDDFDFYKFLNRSPDIMCDFIFLSSQGFKTITCLPFMSADGFMPSEDYSRSVKNLSSLIKYLETFNRECDNPYFIDGLVVTPMLVNHNEDYSKSKNKKPLRKDAFAVKFKGNVYKKTLLSIEKTVSKLNNVTYTATFDPIYEGGKVYQKVKLGSDKFMQEFKLTEGSEVTITITSGIIPTVEGIFEKDGVYTPVNKRNIR